MSGDGCKSLIEVALPIRDISAESVLNKSLRQGNGTMSAHGFL